MLSRPCLDNGREEGKADEAKEEDSSCWILRFRRARILVGTGNLNCTELNECHSCGKQMSTSSTQQQEQNKYIIVNKVRNGRIQLRLKGGDKVSNIQLHLISDVLSKSEKK